MAHGRHRPGTGPQKPIFKDLVIAIAGSLDGQWTEVNVARWVSQRDGHFVAQMGANVTHLVCSEEAYKARGPRVKEALSRPKSCYLVTKDWLEDSINAKRRLKEDAFHPNKKEQEARRMKMEKERRRILEEKEKKGEELAVRAVNPLLWHRYRDVTWFRYEVVISRVEGEVERRFELSLYESNARPHLYWFVAKFFKRKGDSQPNYYRPSDTPGLFWREFSLFEHFFEKKTGIPWEKRLILCNPSTRIADATPASGVAKEEGGLADEKAWVDGDPKKEIWYKLEDEGRRFVYEPPTGGKPVGWAPPEFIPVVVEEDVPVAGEEVKAQAQTLDTTVGVAAQDGRGGEADIAMLDAEEEETDETDSTEMHTPDEEIEDEGVEEEQEEDTDMASDTSEDESEDDSEDESVGAAQEDAVMTMETNTKDLHAGVDEAQEATATLIDAKVQHPDVEEMEASSMQMDTNTRDTSIAGVQGDVVMAMETNPKVSGTSIDQVKEATAMSTDTKTQHPDPEEIHEATAMPVDTTTGDTSIDGVQGDAAMTAKTIANATSVEAQETIAEVPDMEIISDVEGMQEATAMTMMESSTQRTTIEDAQDVTAIMNADAVTEDTYVNLALRAIAILANIKTKDTGVDRAQQGAAMAADSEIKAISVDDVQEVNAMTMDADANSKDIKVEETQEDTPSTSGTNVDSCPAEANTSSALDRDV